MFVTAVALMVDADQGIYRLARAGHDPVLLARGCRVCRVPRSGGMPLGVEPTETYPEAIVGLRDGDRLMAYTDGLVEVDDGVDHLACVRRVLAADPADLRGAIMETLPQGDHPGRDDVTYVVARVSSPHPAVAG